MAKYHNIQIPREVIKAFCQKYNISHLALFGSILREDFDSNSDIDVLIEFKPDKSVGLFRLAGIEQELSELLGRKVDLNTPGFLSNSFRGQVLAEAQVQYEAA